MLPLVTEFFLSLPEFSRFLNILGVCLAFLWSRFTIIRLPYQYEPVAMENTSTGNEQSDSESEQSSSDEEVDEAFELENAWRVQSFS